jgi:aminopeptidase N
MVRRWMVAVVGLMSLMPVTATGQDQWTLAIGDPARKTREASIVLDAITDTRTGALITPAELATRLDDVKVVFVGESHTDITFHVAQLQVITQLQQRGRDVLIGLEMFPYTEQPALDLWNAGTVSEEEFLAKSGWYRNWGYHWLYYRDIFLFARNHGMKMYAVNTPREVVTAVRRKGFQNLTPEEAARIPAKIDTTSEEHKTLFRAFFADDNSLMHTMSGAMFDGMFAAQCTWDATMGYNAVNALKQSGGPKSVMVVLIGSGHVAYGLGIQRQAATWFDQKMASVIPVNIVDEKGKARTSVQASYADYLWGVPPAADPIYPALGFSTRDNKETSSLEVIDVPKDSVAASAGFAVGDVIRTFDGTPVKDRETFNSLMSHTRWSDAVVFTVQRGSHVVTLTAYFRRHVPAAAAPVR